jgi:hypothetical protein
MPFYVIASEAKPSAAISLLQKLRLLRPKGLAMTQKRCFAPVKGYKNAKKIPKIENLGNFGVDIWVESW